MSILTNISWSTGILVFEVKDEINYTISAMASMLIRENIQYSSYSLIILQYFYLGHLFLIVIITKCMFSLLTAKPILKWYSYSLIFKRISLPGFNTLNTLSELGGRMDKKNRVLMPVWRFSKIKKLDNVWQSIDDN